MVPSLCKTMAKDFIVLCVTDIESILVDYSDDFLVRIVTCHTYREGWSVK